MNLGKVIYYGGLRAFGAVSVRRRIQNAGLILCYHNVVSRADDRAGDPDLHLPLERFEAQVRWLKDHYEIVSLGELLDRRAARRSLRSTAVITFDDGYAGVFEHALPFLDRMGCPATVFVVAEAPGRLTGFWWDQSAVIRSMTAALRDRWLTDLRGDEAAILSDVRAPGACRLPVAHRAAKWAAIRAALGPKVGIGVHSVTHRALPALTDPELEHEVQTGRAIMHRQTGAWPEFFAYPYGLSDARVRAAVRAAGYRAALSLASGLNRLGGDPWSLRRVNVPAGISDTAFQAWAAGFRGRGSRG